MSASAYTAVVQHLSVDVEQGLPAVFIVGNDPDDRRAVSEALNHPEYDYLGDYAYWELTSDQWFVARRGQNIGLDFMVQTHHPILKLNIHPWQYATATKGNNQ